MGFAIAYLDESARNMTLSDHLLIAAIAGIAAGPPAGLSFGDPIPGAP